ncbi:MAG: CHAT domain-containing protein [Planctomycetaceae bacterium]
MKRTVGWLLLAWPLLSLLAVYADDLSPPRGIVIQLEPSGELRVQPMRAADELRRLQGPGVVVWDDGLTERCLPLPWPDAIQSPWDTPHSKQPSAPLIGARGIGAVAASTAAVFSQPMDQLLGRSNIRGKSFITPQGRHLFPQITIRRLPIGESFPRATLSILRGTDTIVRFEMLEGQQWLAWTQIPDLPSALKDGLPSGAYTLRSETDGASTSFTIEDEPRRERFLEPLRQLTQLLGTTEGALCVEFELACLLQSDTADSGPYVADALDLLERRGESSRSPHLRLQKDQLLSRMGDQTATSPDGQTALDHATQIETIDRARLLLQQGQWKAALQSLESFVPASSREAAFAELYRAVALAESGPAMEGMVRPMFLGAVAALATDPRDAYLAHNNFACFLLERTQDRLNDYAFQASSGVAAPLMQTLADWDEARHHFAEALRHADDMAAADRAAVRVNLSRLHAVLADLLRGLAPDPALTVQPLEAVATQESRRLAEQVIEEASQDPSVSLDDLTLAVTHEVLAHLAFRRSDGPACQLHADQAERYYLAIGGLAGVESIERLRGLAALRGLSPSTGEPKAVEAKKDALRHFQISHLLSELLRESLPPGEAGLTRAGFFSRRAYVYEQIISLLLEQQQTHQALRYAELAKARSLQDFLMAQSAEISHARQQVDVLDVLRSWPTSGHAAVEYFLGSENAWVFLIEPNGKLTAYLLQDELGQPIASPDLVRRVRTLLSGFENQSQKMTRRLLAGQGFDSGWQDELAALCQILLPLPIRERLHQAKHLVIVPHHILHYLPFAALVTERDPSSSDRQQMAKPRFLIDQPYTLIHSPSITFWHLLQQQTDRPISDVYVVGVEEFELAASLPGVATEIQHLRDVFGDRIRQVVSGANATEERTKRLLVRRGLLMLATHGMNVADHSMDSHLVLSPTADSDGYLTAREVYQADGGIDLVVMSICYSGLADRSPLPGDDLFGLQRAFLQSGSRAVISGLWDVYDQTAPLIMKSLVEQLASGIPAEQALAQSQRQFVNQLRDSSGVEPWLHPYFWAVFTLSGDGRVHFSDPANQIDPGRTGPDSAFGFPDLHPSVAE